MLHGATCKAQLFRRKMPRMLYSYATKHALRHLNPPKSRANAVAIKQLPLADGSLSTKQWPKPKYTYAYDRPKLLYPKMSEYNMQDQLTDDIVAMRVCDWIMVCCVQWCEHEFIYELSQVDLTGFYAYRHQKQICRSLATGQPTGRIFIRERPLLTGIVFVKQDYAYDERKLKRLGRFCHLPKYHRGELCGTLKNGNPKFELVKCPITITTAEAHRLTINSMLAHSDQVAVNFTPRLGMQVVFKPSVHAISPLLMQAATNAKTYVLNYDESSGMCDLMVGNIATSASASDLLPASGCLANK